MVDSRNQFDQRISCAVFIGHSGPCRNLEPTDEPREKNAIVAAIFGSIVTVVAAYAMYETITMTALADWQEFWEECQQDRTYFAFIVDWVLFSMFQPYILQRAKDGTNDSIDFIPSLDSSTFYFATREFVMLHPRVQSH
jgi:hypothetical protein